jgi:hypothetical protein
MDASSQPVTVLAAIAGCLASVPLPAVMPTRVRGVHHPREALFVRRRCLALADHEIADGARVRAIDQGRDAIGVARRAEAGEGSAGCVQVGFDKVVTRPIDRAEFHSGVSLVV